MRYISVLVLAVASALALAQPDLIDALEGARTPEDVVRIVGDWETGDMATWWIDSAGSGDGTDSSTPAPTWATINASLTAGDTVYIRGTLREQIDCSVDTITVDQWPDGDPWTLSGATAIAANGWTLDTDGTPYDVYATANSSHAASPEGLVYDYRLGTAEGVPDLYVGFIPQSGAADLAAARVALQAAPLWWYDATNDRILASFPSNDNPTSSGKTAQYIRVATGNGFKISGDDWTVRNGKIHLFWDDNASNYWGFMLSGSNGAAVENMEASDCYYHSFGSTGGESIDNHFSNITCRSIRRGTDGHIVQYCGLGNTMSGDVFEDVTIHLAASRKYDGTPLETSGNLRGIAGHATGTIGASGGLRFRRCETIRYADEESNGGAVSVVHSGGCAAPGDVTDPSTYPIIHEDCIYEDFGSINLSAADSHCAFIRCQFNTDGTVTSGAVSNSAINIAASAESFFESCTVAGEMSATANHVLFRVSGNAFLSNCSVRAEGSTDGIIFGAATADVDAIHCIFVRANAGSLCKGGSMPQPVFTKCWYDTNISDTLFATPAAFNSQTEWTTLVDANGTYDVDFSAQFASTVTLEPAAASDLKTTLDASANPDAPAGINGTTYIGNAGAWQTAPTIISVTPNTGIQGATDLDLTVTTEYGADGDSISLSGTGITINSTTFVSSTEFTVNVDIAENATASFRDATISGVVAGEETLEAAFTVYPALAAAPNSSGIILYNMMNCSGNYYGTNRGFPTEIINNQYGGTFLDAHATYVSEAAANGVTLGLALQNPYGRGPVQVPMDNGDRTSQRLDQMRQCQVDGFVLIHDSLLANTTPASTFIYVGSVPNETIYREGYYPLLNLGYSMAFDALTVEYDEDPNSEMFARVLALYNSGFDILTEANKVYGGIPLLAFAPLWELASRVQPEDAPAGSTWWWRTAALDGTWNVSNASSFLASGIRGARRLWVRLDQLSEAERIALYEAVVDAYDDGGKAPIGSGSVGLGGGSAHISLGISI